MTHPRSHSQEQEKLRAAFSFIATFLASLIQGNKLRVKGCSWEISELRDKYSTPVLS